MPGIYKITHSASGRCYVGSSVNIERRWREHRDRLKRGVHPNPRLLRAWLKYGADAFNFAILESVEVMSEESRIERENYWIAQCRPVFNLAPVAGSILGMKRTAKNKANASAGQLRRFSTTPHPVKGRARTPEERAAISAGQLGLPKSQDHKRNLSKALMGRVSPRKGVTLSAETKLRISINKLKKTLAGLQAKSYSSNK